MSPAIIVASTMLDLNDLGQIQAQHIQRMINP
jgi:hypothetical protein